MINELFSPFDVTIVLTLAILLCFVFVVLLVQRSKIISKNKDIKKYISIISNQKDRINFHQKETYGLFESKRKLEQHILSFLNNVNPAKYYNSANNVHAAINETDICVKNINDKLSSLNKSYAKDIKRLTRNNEALKSRPRLKWISVDDELPNYEEDVLVAFKSPAEPVKVMRRVRTEKYHGEVFVNIDNRSIECGTRGYHDYCTVTHWTKSPIKPNET